MNWNDRYSGCEFYYGVDPNDFLREQAQRIPSGGRVLCLAEGEGRNAVFLATLGFKVLAVDQSEVGLKKLESLAKEKGVRVETLVQDLSDFEIEPSSYDAIVSIWCHVPPELRRSLHARVVAGLKPGGMFILEAYHPRQLHYKTGGPPVPELMMTLPQLKGELQGLSLVLEEECDRVIHEGLGHSGLSAVTRVIGLKA